MSDPITRDALRSLIEIAAVLARRELCTDDDDAAGDRSGMLASRARLAIDIVGVALRDACAERDALRAQLDAGIAACRHEGACDRPTDHGEWVATRILGALAAPVDARGQAGGAR